MSLRLGYRSETLPTTSSRLRWWPLAVHEFGMPFRSKWSVALFFLCLFPAVGRLVMLLILFGVVNFGTNLRQRVQTRGGNSPLAQLDPSNVEFYLEPVLSVMPGMVFVLLLTSVVMARSVARDRLSNALELFGTRGLSPRQYLFAKWLGSAGSLALITVLAPLLQWLCAVFFAEDWQFLCDTAPTVLLGLLGLAVTTGYFAALCVGLSASSASPNGATVAWALLLVGSASVGTLLSGVLREPELRSSLSVWEAGGALARHIAGLLQEAAPSSTTPLWLCLGLFVAITSLALHRLKPGAGA